MESWTPNLAIAARRRAIYVPGFPAPHILKALRLGDRIQAFFENRLAFHQTAKNGWAQACLELGLLWDAWANANARAIAPLLAEMRRLLTETGEWRHPIVHQDMAMSAYVILQTKPLHPHLKCDAAIEEMAGYLLSRHPRVSDGCLPYSPTGANVLVDTLGLVCPFLASYGRRFNNADATALAVHQLTTFISTNLDADTSLPHHGYIPGGPYRLGVHGWGRGVGWYLIGLIDTLLELPSDHAARPELERAFVAAAESLEKFQRADGHWGWAAILPTTHADASATAFCGYALARGFAAGILAPSHRGMIERALEALRNSTRPDGIVTGSSGECRGLGDYSMDFRPEVWLQGMALAFTQVWSAKPRGS